MSHMNIAQGLRRIKKLKGRMGELTTRASTSVSYDVRKKPAFDFQATRSEIAGIREELVTLEASLARANAVTEITCGEAHMTLAEAIRRLQEYKAEMSWLASLLLRAGVEERTERGYDEGTGRSTVVKITNEYAADLTEVDRAAEIETLRGRFERLNDAVEAANHRTPLDWQASVGASA